MPNSKENSPTTIRLPEQAWHLLDIVRECGEKATRNDIAEKLGKKSLNAGELAYLEVLEMNDFIAVTKEPVHTPMGYQWVYHAVEPESSD